jgi:hypothetical protein
MAGVHPSRNNGEAPWAIAYVYRFRSPEFVPLFAGSNIVSIGSGEEIEEYSKVLQRIGTGFEYLQMEINNPGGSAFGLLHMVTSAVKDMPKRGISRNLHVCIVMRGEIRLATNNRRYFGDSSDDIIMPPVAQSLPELDQMLSDRGRTLTLATC